MSVFYYTFRDINSVVNQRKDMGYEWLRRNSFTASRCCRCRCRSDDEWSEIRWKLRYSVEAGHSKSPNTRARKLLTSPGVISCFASARFLDFHHRENDLWIRILFNIILNLESLWIRSLFFRRADPDLFTPFYWNGQILSPRSWGKIFYFF